MYSNRNCKILHEGFEEQYISAFTKFYLQVISNGQGITLGSELLNANE